MTTKAKSPPPVFEAMLRELAMHRPEAFASDVTVHDKRALAELQPARFFWVLYDAGSHLIIPGTYPGHRLPNYASKICETIKDSCPKARYYLCSDRALNEVPASEFQLRLAEACDVSR